MRAMAGWLFCDHPTRGADLSFIAHLAEAAGGATEQGLRAPLRIYMVCAAR
jgi:hypothetical protein